jgi:hypothetical protein
MAEIEGQWALAGNNLTQLSEMQLVDCDSNDGHCGGGMPYSGMEYLLTTDSSWPAKGKTHQKGQADTTATYPYTYKWNAFRRCNESRATVGAKISDCKTLSCARPMNCLTDWINSGNCTGGAGTKNETGCLKDEYQMRQFIAKHGPVSVGIDATFMQTYTSGLACPNCNFDHQDGYTMDHGVTVVGWGSDTVNGSKMDYWLIKNSWNESWGESGYYRICRGILDRKEQCSAEGSCYEKCGVNEQVAFSLVG